MLIVASASGAAAQSEQGRVTGTVRDQSNGFVGGAAVVVNCWYSPTVLGCAAGSATRLALPPPAASSATVAAAQTAPSATKIPLFISPPWSKRLERRRDYVRRRGVP
jgi:hypothetical protein